MAVLIRRLLALLLLCAPTPALAVFGGQTVPASSPVARSLVAILYKSEAGLGLCTGVLLAPTLVLTAAHCTAGNRVDLRVVFAPTLENVPADRVRMAAATAHPDASPDAAGKSAFNNPDDIALIALAAPAPADATPVRLAGDFAAGTFAVAGYGASSDLAKPNADGKRQLGFDRVLRATTLDIADGDGVLVADQSHGTGLCTGDSGGPAFELTGTTPVVTGLLIGVSNKRNATDFCRGRAWFTSVPRWTPWIVSAARSLGVTLSR